MERLSHTETVDIPVHDIRTYTMATKKNGGKKMCKRECSGTLGVYIPKQNLVSTLLSSVNAFLRILAFACFIRFYPHNIKNCLYTLAVHQANSRPSTCQHYPVKTIEGRASPSEKFLGKCLIGTEQFSSVS